MDSSQITGQREKKDSSSSKNISWKKILFRSLIVSSIVVLFIASTGGNLNPMVWMDQIDRRAHPEHLLETDEATLLELEREFEFFVRNVENGLEFPCFESNTDFHNVHCFITRKIEYKDDLSNYYGFDYLATANEVLSRKADDCDGKAVLTVILLRAQGYDASLALGTTHTWVEAVDNGSYIYIGRLDCSDPVFITDTPLGVGPGVYALVSGDEVLWYPLPFIVQILEIFAALFAFLALLQVVVAYGLHVKPLNLFTEMVSYLKYLIYMLLLVFGVWVLLLLLVKLLYERSLG